ncbi:MAG TPA: histidine phosphotransferase family protein [Caulobacteraceae bacterium]|nr:histidine phosphotransferase family protein [Caulobacteraceae bacterium]
MSDPQNLASHLHMPQEPVGAQELAAHLAARLCHDFLSPAGAIMSGLDLLNDPSAQDMREDALGLIATGGQKLMALLEFDRVAFGASTSAEAFETTKLEQLARDVFAHLRPELDWKVAAPMVPKPCARALLNLAQIGAGALPTGGVAEITLAEDGASHLIRVHARGPRARLRSEMVEGLKGLPLGEGLSGYWIQPYYLWALADTAGGDIAFSVGEDEVTITVRLPA